VDELTAVDCRDLLDLPFPPAFHRFLVGRRDRVLAEPVLDERQQAGRRLRVEVVEHQPLALHLDAQRPRQVWVAGVDRRDDAVERRA